MHNYQAMTFKKPTSSGLWAVRSREYPHFEAVIVTETGYGMMVNRMTHNQITVDEFCNNITNVEWRMLIGGKF